MNRLIALAFLFTVNISDAQHAYPISAGYPWSSWFTNAGARPKKATAFRYNYGYIYTPSNEVIVTARGVEEDPGMVKFNSNGKKVWELKNKSTLELSMLNNNIITFYTEPSPDKKRHKMLYAVLVDADKGKMIRQKELGVYNEYDYKFSAIKDKNNNFHGLAITYSKEWDVDKLDILSFDEQLNKINELHYTYSKNMLYYGIAVNTKGNYFIASSKNGFTVDMINKKGDVLASVNYPEHIFKDNVQELITLQPSALDPLKLFVGIQYKNEGWNNLTLIMDFNKSTVIPLKDKLNKDFEQTLKSKVEETKTLNYTEGLGFRGFAETKDKLISVREIEYYDEPKKCSVNAAIVVTTYNMQLQKPSYIVIPKSMLVIHALTGTPGFHLRDNTLHIVYPLRLGLNSFSAAGYTIDLTNEKIQPIDFSKINHPKEACLEGDATFWLKDGYYLHYKDAVGYKNQKVTTYLQRMDY